MYWKKPFRRRSIEQFEARHFLTGIALIAHDAEIAGKPLAVSDIDGDGDLDIVVERQHGRGNRVLWLSNLDGKGAFGKPTLILQNGAYQGMADWDGDGDLDVVSSDRWYPNDGTGVFGDAVDLFDLGTVIEITMDSFIVAETSQNDGLGYFFSGYLFDGDSDKEGLFWVSKQRETIYVVSDQSWEILHANSSAAVDLNGDEDIDLVYYSNSNSGGVHWLENTDGEGAFGPPKQFVAGAFISLTTGDLDGDGYVDVVISGPETTTSWFPGTGNGFGPKRPLEIEFSAWIKAADVDLDGDVDLLIDGPGVCCALGWSENEDGRGNLSSPKTLVPSIRPRMLADIDGDGDVDVIGADLESSKVIWYQNRLVGDADDDNEVSFDDFVKLAGNFGKVADAVWEDGDFNGDTKVDFADFLLLAANFGSKREA